MPKNRQIGSHFKSHHQSEEDIVVTLQPASNLGKLFRVVFFLPVSIRSFAYFIACCVTPVNFLATKVATELFSIPRRMYNVQDSNPGSMSVGVLVLATGRIEKVIFLAKSKMKISCQCYISADKIIRQTFYDVESFVSINFFLLKSVQTC